MARRGRIASATEKVCAVAWSGFGAYVVSLFHGRVQECAGVRATDDWCVVLGSKRSREMARKIAQRTNGRTSGGLETVQMGQDDEIL
jgi:hypothetical protein